MHQPEAFKIGLFDVDLIKECEVKFLLHFFFNKKIIWNVITKRWRLMLFCYFFICFFFFTWLVCFCYKKIRSIQLHGSRTILNKEHENADDNVKLTRRKVLTSVHGFLQFILANSRQMCIPRKGCSKQLISLINNTTSAVTVGPVQSTLRWYIHT